MADTQSPFVKNPDFTSIKTTCDSITVTWEKATDNVTPADKITYQVFFKENNSPEDFTCVGSAWNLSSFQIRNLKPDTEYLLFVLALDEAGNYTQYPAKNASKLIRTAVYDKEAPKVKDAKFQDIMTSADSITVTWEKATDNITPADKIEYLVYFKENNAPGNMELVATAKNITCYTFRNLKKETEYIVQVRAVDQAGNILFYPALNAGLRIKTGVYDDQAPTVSDTQFKTIESTYDSITVTWEKATDNVTPADQIEYTVYIKEDSDTGNSTPVYTGKNLTSYTFKGLKEDTEYNVHVVAKDKAGYFVQYPAQCAVMRIRTKVYDVEPPTVANTHFKTIETTHDSITVTWERAIDNISSADKIKYHVYIKESSDPGEPTLAEAKPNLTSYTFRGLKADTEYLVHVKARDEADNYVRYPAKNASMRIRTKVYDPVAPQARDTQFRTILTTTNSITVTWEKATDNVTAADKIKYTVYIGEDKPNEKLKPVHTAKNLETYSFNGLKPYTEYLVKVVAEDEAGNYIQYPAKNASMRIKTNPADKEAPKVTSRAFKVSDLLDDRFTIQWEKATDNNTPTSSIRYEVGVTETGNPRDPWRIETKQGISSYTFTGLKPNTAYACFVQAYDYAGNLLRYPSDNANQIVRTSAKRVHSISFTVEQKATVLPGTNSISFGIEYNYYQVDAQGNIIGHGSGAWEAKWSNKSTKKDTITLPPNCYFEGNQVFIRIRSRKAASAGLNKWTACSSGYVDVSSGVLKFRLIGNYFYYTVRLGGTAEEGYSLFK